LSPFLRENASVVPVNRREDFATIPSTSGLVAIYVVGHAWMDDQQFRTSIRSREGSHLLTGHEFAEMLLASPLSGATELILLVDTCNAAGLINEIKTLRRSTNTCVIAASSEGQSTLEYPLDRTTRFAAALKASIGKAQVVLDAVELAADVRKRLGRPGIMPSQSASYWVSGDPIRIEPRNETNGRDSRLSRTYLVLRSLLIAGGVVLAALAVWAFTYYRNHALITLQLPDLQEVANSAAIEIREESLENNGSNKIVEFPVLSLRRLQFRLPATNLLIITKAAYKDGASREVRFHLNLAPGLLWSRKTPNVALAVRE